jgi:hypothetical protein
LFLREFVVRARREQRHPTNADTAGEGDLLFADDGFAIVIDCDAEAVGVQCAPVFAVEPAAKLRNRNKTETVFCWIAFPASMTAMLLLPPRGGNMSAPVVGSVRSFIATSRSDNGP